MKTLTFENVEYMDSPSVDRVVRQKQNVYIDNDKIVLAGYLNATYKMRSSRQTNRNIFYECIKDGIEYTFCESKDIKTLSFYLRIKMTETYLFFDDDSFD